MMDRNEATATLLRRIQALDPDYACKIMGFLLFNEPGDQDMVNLAMAPDTHLISLINHVKIQLGISSNTLSVPSVPSPFNPLPDPHRPEFLSKSAPRVIVPTGFSPTPPPVAATSPSYPAVVVNGTSMDPFSDMQDANYKFLDPIMSPGGWSDSVLYNEAHRNMNNLHRRSFSVSDAFLDENNNGGWRPCMYFAKGFCKNGSNCKFVHESPDAIVGSPKIDPVEEMLRVRAIQQQRFAAMVAGRGGGGGAPFPYDNRYNSCC